MAETTQICETSTKSRFVVAEPRSLRQLDLPSEVQLRTKSGGGMPARVVVTRKPARALGRGPVLWDSKSAPTSSQTTRNVLLGVDSFAGVRIYIALWMVNFMRA